VVVAAAPISAAWSRRASYRARKYARALGDALRESRPTAVRTAVFLEGHPERYRRSAAAVRRVLLQFTPVVEMASIDEAYLDMTGTLAAPRTGDESRGFTASNHAARKRAELLGRYRQRARRSPRLPAIRPSPTACCTFSKVSKPAFLAPLDVRRLPGVGKVTEDRLRASTACAPSADLARLSEAALGRKIGDGLGCADRKGARTRRRWMVRSGSRRQR